MGGPTSLSVQDRDLRACVRDLVALSSMPAWWIGRSRSAIAESARDLLLSMLRADGAYVRVRDPKTDHSIVATFGITAKQAEEAGQDWGPQGFARWPIGLDAELGRLAACSSRHDFPTEIELLLLQVTANQVAVALRYAALLASHEQMEGLLDARATQQAAAARLGVRIIAGMGIGEVLAEAVKVVTETLHADYCEVLELAEDGESLLLEAGTGWRTGWVGSTRVSSGPESHVGYTLTLAEPVIVADMGQETRFSPSPLLSEHDVRSGVTVIIHNRTRPYGVLGAHTREHRVFTPDDVHFLQSVANLLAGAFQRHHAEDEREGLLQQTQRAVASRDRAVGIVSHDLRTPLSTIQICAEALLDPVAPPMSGIRNMAQLIQRSTGWMQQIVQDLLDRASLDAGTLALELEPTAVAEVVDEVQGMFAPVAEEHALELVVDKGVDLPLIDADPRRLLQVLSNLLSNAVKFTPAGGRVVLSVEKAVGDSVVGHGAPGRGSVRFAVRDTGPGMPPEDVAHIFDWFWHSPKGGGGGTGLGLAIAKGLIEAHHGSLRVETAPGQGSTFWFTVPAAMPGSAQLPAVPPSPAA